MNTSAPLTRVVRVGVADKNPLIQAGLRQLLTEDPRFEPVFTAADSQALLDAVDATEMNVVVTGWVMPGGGGKYIFDHLAGREGVPRVVI